MKKIYTIIISILLAVCVLLGACTTEQTFSSQSENKTCKVVLSESPYYTCAENVKTVTRGSDVDFTVVFERGYSFESTSYDDYSVDVAPMDENGKTTAILTLKAVQFASFVSIEVKFTSYYTVSIDASPFFRCDTPKQLVEEGKNAVFTLFFQEEYTLAEIDYSGNYQVTGVDSDINDDHERKVVLTVENVTKDAKITVQERKALPPTTDGPIELPKNPKYAVIGYVLNGGWYVDDGHSGSYYTVNDSLEYHRRPNTSIGTDMISRYGYVLTGWNTKADGTGEHIGLGSRADVAVGETLVLYAEWAAWTDVSLFDYVVIDTEDILTLYVEKQDKLQKLNECAENAASADRSAVITKYRGTDAETLVIPERLGGYPVAIVANGALKNDTRVQTVVFPLSMRYIMEHAFLYCEALNELYLYDNLSYVDEYAFGERNETDPRLGEHIQTLHINAKRIPIYGKNESAQLANKMEMLMAHQDEKKTIIFGSCSIWYSLHAKTFGEGTGRLAFNMGVEGETCTLVQLDLIRQYMQDGDELIYACDLGSPYLWGYELSFDARTYRMFEFNYDLLADVNLQRYTNTISSLNEYCIVKNSSLNAGTTGSYDDHLEYISEYGDMETVRNGPSHEGFCEFMTKQTLKENGALEKTKAILQEFADVGIDVYYWFGPFSEVCLDVVDSEDVVKELNAYFIEGFEELDVPAKLLGDIYTVILPDEWFFNTPYRLNSEGTKLHTQTLIELFLKVTR